VLELIETAASKRKDPTFEDGERVADRLRVQGSDAYLAGKFRKAINVYTQSLEAFEDFRCFCNRALCHMKEGNLEEAVDDACKATKLNPTFEKAHVRKALGRALTRDLPRAKMTAKAGLKHCPESEKLRLLTDELDALGVGMELDC